MELVFMFAPFAVVLFGLLGEWQKVPKLREIVAMLASLATLVGVWQLYTMVRQAPRAYSS